MKIKNLFKRKTEQLQEAPVDTLQTRLNQTRDLVESELDRTGDSLQKRLGEMEKQNSSVSLAGANQYSHDNLRDSLYFLDRAQKEEVTQVPQKEAVDSIRDYAFEDLLRYAHKYIASFYITPSEAVRTRKFSRKHLPDALYSEPYWTFDDVSSKYFDLDNFGPDDIEKIESTDSCWKFLKDILYREQRDILLQNVANHVENTFCFGKKPRIKCSFKIGGKK